MDTLVINADGMPVSVLPISTVSWKDAILYMYHDKCDVMEWYDDWMVRSPSWETKVPAVIMLKSYLHRKNSVRFSKYNVYLRDEYKCVYCGFQGNNQNLTIDHHLALSKGGKTNWNNILTACSPCNTKKGNRNILKPRYLPYKPDYYELVEKRKKLPLNIKHESWRKWLNLHDDMENQPQ